MGNFLIIGASSAIAQSAIDLLKHKGHHLFQTSRNHNKINPNAVLDATNFDAVDKVFEQAIATLGSLDGVLNAAGSILLKPAHLTNFDQYNAVVQTSLTTSFATVRAAGKYMTKGGAVVLMTSAAAMRGIPNHEAIAAAKAGVIGLTLSAAASYASQGLRVNAVAPGLTHTPLTENLFTNQASLKVSEMMHSLGRLGDPEDIGRAIAFLLDPENSWITGQVLAVDGGLSTLMPKMKIG